MGCDIHMNIEVKTENGWELYSKPKVDRNYRLFAKLANVRNYDNEIIPISNPRGLPEDVSYLVKKSYERWDTDAHSASYITCEELDILQKWLKEFDLDLEHNILNTYCEGNSFLEINESSEGSPDWIFDCRLVFWFDN
jgi:hypothetical protein